MGIGLFDRPDERQLIEQVGLHERDAVQDVLDAPGVGRAQATDDPEDLVALLEEEFREVRTILSRDAGD